MLKKALLLSTLLLSTTTAPLLAEAPRLGFVDFKECLEKSKQGKREKGAFDELKNQLQAKLKESEKELESIARKLEDQDYMDGLSPAAEQELQLKFQTLSQEFGHFQNQYYQLLNQANMKLFQSLHQQVSSASEKVREKQQLAMILNEESVFSSAPSLNCTNQVIAEMDRRFDLENNEAVISE